MPSQVPAYRYKRFIKIKILLASVLPGVCLIFPASLWSGPLILKSSQQVYSLQGAVLEVHRDSTQNHKFIQISDPNRSITFYKNPQKIPNYGITENRIWLRFSLHNRSNRSHWYLVLEHANLGDFTLYTPSETGYQYSRIGTDYPFQVRKHMNRFPVMEIDIASGEEKTYYLSVSSDSAMFLPMKIFPPEKFRTQAHNSQLIFGIFVGIIFIITLYNLFLFISLRDITYLYYVCFVLVFGLSILSINGQVFEYLVPSTWTYPFKTSLFLAGTTWPFIWLFTIQFLELSGRFPIGAPRLRNFVLIAYCIVHPMLILLGSTKIYSGVIILFLFITPPCLIGLGIYAYLKGLKAAVYYLLSWTFLLFGVSIFALKTRGILPHNFLTHNGLLLGFCMQVILLSFALAARVKHYRLAHKAAELANQTKSEFLANMSHEIRTPLSAVLGTAELLEDSPLSEEQRGHVRMLRDAGKRLLHLTNDLLDVSRIESGRMELEQSQFSIRDVLKETVHLLNVQASSKNLVVSWGVHQDVPEILVGDSHRLRQVLINILGNAIKFSSKGEISVKLGAIPRLINEKTAHLRFAISDTGPGIPREKQNRIFESFMQADTSTTRRYGGSGLGLTISRRLVQLMGGRLWVASEPGHGSTFYFTVKFDVPEEEKFEDENLSDELNDAPQKERENLEEGVRKKDLTTVSETSPEKTSVKIESPTPVAGNNIQALPDGQGAQALEESREKLLSILVAEDNEDNRLLLGALLKKEPFRLNFAENGLLALNMFREETYDVILMDMQMPIMDGYTATREIRKLEEERGNSPLPIIALTAHAMHEETVKILASGCDIHLTKPINKVKLIQTILEFTAQREEREVR